MSFPIDIRFRPAYYRLAPDRKKKIRIAREHAVREAFNSLWNFWGDKLAKKTGRFRTAVRGMITSQFLKLGRDKLTIRFLKLSGPKWNIYHIFGPEGESRTTAPYKNPTTLGTRPLNEFQFMDMFEDLIIKHMKFEFAIIKQKNFKPKWSKFVKVL